MEPWNSNGYVSSSYPVNGGYVTGPGYESGTVYENNEGYGMGPTGYNAVYDTNAAYGSGDGSYGYQSQIPMHPGLTTQAIDGYGVPTGSHTGYDTVGYGSGPAQGGYPTPGYVSSDYPPAGNGGYGTGYDNSGVGYQSQVQPGPSAPPISSPPPPPPPQERPVKEKKKTTRKKEPTNGKKSASAYAHFFRDVQARIKEANKTVSFGDISKIVAAEWDALSVEEKAYYKKKAENAKNNQFRDIALSHAMAVAGGQLTNPSGDNNQ